MSHINNDEEKTIAYASRSLTGFASEQNFDREALVIMFGVSYFYNYLYTLHPNYRQYPSYKNLSRKQILASYDFQPTTHLCIFSIRIQLFNKGKTNADVDCLSWAPVTEQSETMDIFLNIEKTTL